MILVDKQGVPIAFTLDQRDTSYLGQPVRLCVEDDEQPTYHYVRSIAPWKNDEYIYRLGRPLLENPIQ